MGKEAYLAGALNAAIVCEEDTCSFVQAGVANGTPIDGYLFAQLRAIKPELKRINFESNEELFEKLFMENVQQKALNQALELMDVQLSGIYRNKVAMKLAAKLDIHTGLIDFLKNRLYSRILPKSFDPALALAAIGIRNENLSEIYKDLREKSGMFGRFYTLLQMSLTIGHDELESIDTALADCSAYANFTLALFTRSSTLYNYAISLSIKNAGPLNEKITEHFFLQIRRKLRENYDINLRASHWINLCDRSQHVAVMEHRFYGSPLKTMFNYYQEHLPFTSHQVIDVVSRNLSFYMTAAETPKQYECRMFDQTLDELDFLRGVRSARINPEPLASVRVNGLRGFINTEGVLSAVRQTYPLINLKYPQIFVGVLFADDLFLNRHYDDAILAYSGIVQQTVPDRRRSSYLSDLFIYMTTNIKMAVIYEKLHRNDEAKELLYEIHSKLNKYADQDVRRKETVSEQGRGKVGFVLHRKHNFFPDSSDYIKSFYDNVSAIIAETGALKP